MVLALDYSCNYVWGQDVKQQVNSLSDLGGQQQKPTSKDPVVFDSIQKSSIYRLKTRDHMFQQTVNYVFCNSTFITI